MGKKYKWHKVAAAAADIQWSQGNVASVEVNGKSLCLGRFQDQWYGFANFCPHAGAPLTDGFIDAARPVDKAIRQRCIPFDSTSRTVGMRMGMDIS